MFFAPNVIWKSLEAELYIFLHTVPPVNKKFVNNLNIFTEKNITVYKEKYAENLLHCFKVNGNLISLHLMWYDCFKSFAFLNTRKSHIHHSKVPQFCRKQNAMRLVRSLVSFVFLLLLLFLFPFFLVQMVWILFWNTVISSFPAIFNSITVIFLPNECHMKNKRYGWSLIINFAEK